MDPEAARRSDRVILRQIPFNLSVGPDAWGRDKPQPVLLSLEIPYDFQRAAANDDVSHTLDYGKLYKSLNMALGSTVYSPAGVALRIREILHPVLYFEAKVVLPKGSLRAEGGLHFTFEYKAAEMPQEFIFMQELSIKGIRCACIVGVNPHERVEKQIVIVNLDFRKTDILHNGGENVDDISHSHVPYSDVVQRVVEQVEGSTYQTVEALATAIAKTVTVRCNVPAVWIEVEKPNAIAAVEAAGVRIYREKSFFTEDNFWQIRRP